MKKFIYKIKFWIWGIIYRIDRLKILLGFKLSPYYTHKRTIQLFKILKGMEFLKEKR